MFHTERLLRKRDGEKVNAHNSNWSILFTNLHLVDKYLT
jgi:hypothetical protein